MCTNIVIEEIFIVHIEYHCINIGMMGDYFKIENLL